MSPRHLAFRFAVVALVLLLATPGPAGAGSAPAAPDFELPLRDGASVSLTALRGKVVMVNFWASWCGPCRQEFPVLEAMYRKYAALGFALLAINVESDQADAQRFLAATPVSFPVAFDTENKVSAAYGVSAMPTTFLVDRKGQLRWSHRAYRPGDENEYLDQLRAMLREDP